MDLSFPMNDAARGHRRAVALDYAMLVAGVASGQAASRTAAIAASLRAPAGRRGDPAGALAALILGDRDWTSAAAALAGSFHPKVAGKAALTNMKLPFTFAFSLPSMPGG